MELAKVKKEFESVVDNFIREIARIRVGAATPSLVEDVKVEAYESVLTLKEVATISAPEPTSLIITPWDNSVREAIVKGVQAADLGLNPVVDGEMIRVPVPRLSEERRREMRERVGRLAEDARVGVRKLRQKRMQEVEKREEAGEISEDELFRLKEKLQGLVEETNSKIERLRSQKESELS